MSSLRVWVAVTLCLVLAAVSAPAVQASPAHGDEGPAIAVSWLDWVQSTFSGLLSWTNPPEGDSRPVAERSRVSPTHPAAKTSGPTPIFGATGGETCDPNSTEHGCTNDPDG